ncbi:MAG: guanylate kinase [Gammaproteobacteria bacterium]|nr:guanylate kinase [Gammaproteobacteria bacterium]
MGKLFIVSAPSGAGKTSLVRALINDMDDVVVSVSHTTRAPRPGEQDGRDYHFVSQERFNELVDAGAFLEYARVFDNAYGTTRQSVEDQMAAGRNVILEIDWQGAQQVRKMCPDAVTIYINPPSKAVLEERLRSRGQDDEAVIARRMRQADEEMSHAGEYDYCVINDDFKTALGELKALIRASAKEDRR